MYIAIRIIKFSPIKYYFGFVEIGIAFDMSNFDRRFEK
jgi:hypothetical protein